MPSSSQFLHVIRNISKMFNIVAAAARIVVDECFIVK